jgi:K+-transporting ATPase KdpF subunit
LYCSKLKAMVTIILSSNTDYVEAGISAGYLVASVIAVFILLYLLYSLIKPDKF